MWRTSCQGTHGQSLSPPYYLIRAILLLLLTTCAVSGSSPHLKTPHPFRVVRPQARVGDRGQPLGVDFAPQRRSAYARTRAAATEGYPSSANPVRLVFYEGRQRGVPQGPRQPLSSENVPNQSWVVHLSGKNANRYGVQPGKPLYTPESSGQQRHHGIGVTPSGIAPQHYGRHQRGQRPVSANPSRDVRAPQSDSRFIWVAATNDASLQNSDAQASFVTKHTDYVPTVPHVSADASSVTYKGSVFQVLPLEGAFRYGMYQIAGRNRDSGGPKVCEDAGLLEEYRVHQYVSEAALAAGKGSEARNLRQRHAVHITTVQVALVFDGHGNTPVQEASGQTFGSVVARSALKYMSEAVLRLLPPLARIQRKKAGVRVKEQKRMVSKLFQEVNHKLMRSLPEETMVSGSTATVVLALHREGAKSDLRGPGSSVGWRRNSKDKRSHRPSGGRASVQILASNLGDSRAVVVTFRVRKSHTGKQDVQYIPILGTVLTEEQNIRQSQQVHRYAVRLRRAGYYPSASTRSTFSSSSRKVQPLSCLGTGRPKYQFFVPRGQVSGGVNLNSLEHSHDVLAYLNDYHSHRQRHSSGCHGSRSLSNASNNNDNSKQQMMSHNHGRSGSGNSQRRSSSTSSSLYTAGGRKRHRRRRPRHHRLHRIQHKGRVDHSNSQNKLIEQGDHHLLYDEGDDRSLSSRSSSSDHSLSRSSSNPSSSLDSQSSRSSPSSSSSSLSSSRSLSSAYSQSSQHPRGRRRRNDNSYDRFGAARLYAIESDTYIRVFSNRPYSMRDGTKIYTTGLQLTGSFGDRFLEPIKVCSRKPSDVQVVKLNPADEHTITVVLVASDGLWDAVPPSLVSIGHLLAKHLSKLDAKAEYVNRELSVALAKYATGHSLDDVTVATMIYPGYSLKSSSGQLA